MKYILSGPARARLARFAEKDCLLAFDYDGTLAPIVKDPDRAEMRPTTRMLLEEVARYYPCVVISGRSVHDLAGRLKGINVVRLIGNHGNEESADQAVSQADRKKVGNWASLLEQHLRRVQGITIEDKGMSLAIHYRKAPDKSRAVEVIAQAIECLEGIRVIDGKCVVNVLPAEAVGKGVALRRIRLELGSRRALYVGDDVTDEDVFKSPDHGLLTVRVRRSLHSHASYYLRSQKEVDVLLRLLLAEAGVNRGIQESREGRGLFSALPERGAT